jgi:Arginyl-tRNA synthetase
MLKTKKELKEKIISRLISEFPLKVEEVELTATPDQSLGDLALSFAFPLAKKLRTRPQIIASRAVELLTGLDGVDKVQVAGAGYINLFLDRKKFFIQKFRQLKKTGLEPEEKKIIVEHTNINPNKAAHVGHLRNACLGDTLVRCLRYKGEQVEVQNYIDDTGVQVVDVVFGFIELEKKSLEEIKRLRENLIITAGIFIPEFLNIWQIIPRLRLKS